MKTTSIRFRLITRLASALAAVAVSANAGLFIYLRGELIEQYDDTLGTQAEAVAVVWRTIGNGTDAEAAIVRAFPKLRFGRPGGHSVWVVRPDGTVVLEVPSAATSARTQGWRTAPTSESRVYDLTLPNGRPGRAIRINVGPPMTDAAANAATGYKLILAEARREMDQTVSSFGIWLFVIGGGLSAVAIWLVLVIVSRELRPLSEFSDAVGRLSADSLTYRFPTAGLADELLPVSTRLNDLLQRLDAAFIRERRFTGNVAHELRTPLAELRSMVEVATRWPPESADLHRHHEHVLEVVQRMSTVTQTLLTLVRSEGTKLAASITEVDLVPLLKSAALPHERAAAARDVGIDLNAPSCRVLADAEILTSLFDNLFSNAATYSTPGTRIVCEVLIEPERQAVIVRLTNAVVDLTADDLARLDEPFWRKDPARSPSDHAGLGLTLVRTYAAATRVEVSFRLQMATHLVVEVLIPCCGTSTPS